MAWMVRSSLAPGPILVPSLSSTNPRQPVCLFSRRPKVLDLSSLPLESLLMAMASYLDGGSYLISLIQDAIILTVVTIRHGGDLQRSQTGSLRLKLD